MSPGSLRRQAAHSVKWTSSAMVVTTIVGLVQLGLLTRLLDRADFGLMAMVATVVGFAHVYADMGFSAAIIYRQEATREQLSSLYWTNIAVSILIGAAVAALSPLVAAFYGQPELVGPLLGVSLVFVITPFGQQFQMLLQRELRFRTLAVIDIAASLAGLAVAVSAALAGAGVWALVLAQLATTTVRAASLAGVGWRRWRPTLHARRADLKGFTGFGLYQMGERSISYWAANIDYLLIGRVLGPEQLGTYTIAYQIVVMPLMKITPVLTRVAFPVFARKQDDDAALRRGYLELIGLIAFVTFPLLIGLAATAPVAMPVLLGAAWASSAVIVQLLTPMGMVKTLSSPSGSLYLSKGRADYGFWFNVVFTSATVVTLWVAVYHGIAWVAAANSALALVFVAVELGLLHRVSGLSPRAYLRGLAAPLGFALAMGVVVLGSRLGLETAFGATLPVLAALVGIGASVYLGLWWLLRRDYVRGIRDLLRRRPIEDAAA